VRVGEDIVIAPDYQKLEDCVTIEATHEYFEIITPLHVIQIKYMWNNIPHLNTSYLDLEIDLAPGNVVPSNYGGMFGGRVLCLRTLFTLNVFGVIIYRLYLPILFTLLMLIVIIICRYSWPNNI